MWEERSTVFEDRTDAGRRLAEELLDYRGPDTIVLGLPRGGIVVAFEIARALSAPLDVLVTRKLGAPGREELGIGAIAPDGVRVLDEETIDLVGISNDSLDLIAARETDEMERRRRLYRGDRPLPDLRDCTVILVDDGLATGVTARAAVAWLRLQSPRRIVLAAPVCAPETAERLRSEVDDLVCISCPPDFRAVGLWFRAFEQTTDEEVIDLLERARTDPSMGEDATVTTVRIACHDVTLEGDLAIPSPSPQRGTSGGRRGGPRARGIILFAHGSGSSRHSSRNRYVAGVLNEGGFATLLIDLLTPGEEAVDARAGRLRFDIAVLGERLVQAADWLRAEPATRALPIGCFGASTGAAAALIAAAERPEAIVAVVSRGGRPDLADDALGSVVAPTLLIVGGNDEVVIELNEQAFERLDAMEKQLTIVPGATHLFEEPGALEVVARLAADWFARYVRTAGTADRTGSPSVDSDSPP